MKFILIFDSMDQYKLFVPFIKKKKWFLFSDDKNDKECTFSRLWEMTVWLLFGKSSKVETTTTKKAG